MTKNLGKKILIIQNLKLYTFLWKAEISKVILFSNFQEANLGSIKKSITVFLKQ